MAIPAWKKAIAEFIGAFTLVFIGAGAIISTGGRDLLLVALAHGLAIGVMVSAFARISGGHFNPAVTIGALVAALALFGIFPSSVWQPVHLGTPALGTTANLGWDVSVGTGILVEAILTFLLVFVIYGTGIDPKGTFNAVGGFAIGLTVAIDIMMGGPLTGAAMNPARWFGPAVVAGFFDNWYVYWVGPFIGAVVAGLLYANVFLEKSS